MFWHTIFDIFSAIGHYLTIIELSLAAIIVLSTFIGIFAGGNTWTRMIALGFDFFWSVFTGGKPGTTVSARAYVANQNKVRWGVLLNRGLNRLEKNHCQLAVQGDINRAKAVIEYLSPYDDRTNQQKPI